VRGRQFHQFWQFFKTLGTKFDYFFENNVIFIGMQNACKQKYL
jgi:hypothetical protein